MNGVGRSAPPRITRTMPPFSAMNSAPSGAKAMPVPRFKLLATRTSSKFCPIGVTCADEGADAKPTARATAIARQTERWAQTSE